MNENGFLPELYQDGAPNIHTPLAWAHALGIIAAKKLR
jgi:GH15 family glucan-1,4-alpha-glucosidase